MSGAGRQASLEGRVDWDGNTDHLGGTVWVTGVQDAPDTALTLKNTGSARP